MGAYRFQIQRRFADGSLCFFVNQKPVRPDMARPYLLRDLDINRPGQPIHQR